MAGRGWSIAKIIIGVLFVLVALSNMLNGTSQTRGEAPGHAAGAMTGTVVLVVLAIVLVWSGFRGLRSKSGPASPTDR